MGKLFIAMLLCAMPGVAAAQDLDPFQSANETAKLGSMEPFARLTVDGAWGDPADAFSFFQYSDKPYGSPDRRRGFAVRKASRTESEPVWSDSFSCPQLQSIIVALEEVDPPRIDIWGFGRDYPIGLATDGVSFNLRVRWPAWPDTTGYELQISSNYGSPLAEWANRLYRELDGCWRSTAPSAG